MEFFQFTIDKHQLPESQASAYRTAARRVLALEDDPDSVDVANMDEEDFLRRFRIKNRTGLTEQSFSTYASRFRRGRDMYLKWLNHDPDWAGKRRKGNKSSKPGSSEQGSVTRKPSTTQSRTFVDSVPMADSVVAAEPELFDYPVALVDSKVVAILRLPRSYTKSDAERMAALINALAVPDVAIDKA
jgi:hypothetical protein